METNKFSALQIEYSSVCNMHAVCKHCYGATGILNTEETISDATMDVILTEAKYIADSITVTGGEPAMFPQMTQMICNESGLPVFIMTNGKAVIENIAPASVLFSLDGNDARPGVDPDEVIHNVLKYNCNLACNTVLTSELDLLEYFQKVQELNKVLLSRDQHLREWKLGFVVNRGRAAEHEELFPDIDTVFKQLREFLIMYFKEPPFHLAIRGFLYTKFLTDKYVQSIKNFTLLQERNPCLDCYGRGEILTINTEGCVQMCTVHRDVSEPIGDSLIDAVYRLLQRKEFTELTYKDWTDCHRCRYWNICGGGCPSLAQSYGGTWTGKDTFQCVIMEKWEEYILPILPSTIRDSFQALLS